MNFEGGGPAGREPFMERHETAPERQPSYYQCILEALDGNGCLPESFSLPKDHDDGELRFADGAMDGIRVYHMAGNEAQIGPLCEAAKLASEKQFEEAEKTLLDCFSSKAWNGMLNSVDEFQQWVVDHQGEINPGEIYRFSSWLLSESRNAESIKFALSLLELLNVEEDENIREKVLTLSNSDEFTLFCLFLVGKWQDANEQTFEIAKKVNGWGRVHAVDRLEPETEEIRDWLLTEGFRNSIVWAYSAMTCIEKGDLLERLGDGTLPTGHEDDIHALVGAALPGGPVAAMDGYDQGEALMESYLSWAEGLAPTTAMAETLRSLSDLLPGWAWESKDALLSRCKALLTTPDALEASQNAEHV